MDPRNDIGAALRAASANIEYAVSTGWRVNPRYYPDGEGSPDLVRDIAGLQAESQSGRVDGVPLGDLGLKPLTIDGMAGPKTREFMRVLVDELGAVEQGAMGPPTQAQWWADAVTFTAPLAVVEVEEAPRGNTGGAIVAEVVDLDDGLGFDFDFDEEGIEIEVPDPPSGGGGLVFGIAAALALGLALS